MSQIDAQCSATDWRATPLAHNPTPNDQFQPTALEYYTNTVLHATWPAFVGLGAFAVLLLAFTLWRLISACARCVHRRKLKTYFPNNEIPSTSSFNSRRKKVQSVKGKTATAFRWILCLLFLGVVAGCIYGMVKINSELVNEGLNTVASAKNYASGVIGSINDIISAGNAIDTALFSTQNIVDVNINATDVTTQLECLRPWLQDLPAPVPIRSEVLSEISMLSTLTPLLQNVSQSLSTLASQNPAGQWIGTLPTLLESQTSLQDLLTQIQSFSTAANAVNPSTDLPGTMLAARNALNALLNSPGFSTKIANINTTVTALENTKQAIIDADEAMQNALTVAEDILTGPATSLNTTMSALTESYATARPCMLALEARTQEINQTVILLPTWLEENMALLEDTETRLDGMLQVESVDQGALTTSQRLDQALTEAELQLATAQGVATQLSNARQNITSSGDFTTLITSLRSLGTTMAASQTPLTNLLNAMNAYLAGSPTIYSVLAGQVRAAGTSAAGTASSLQQWLTSASPVFTQAETMLTQLQTSSYTSGISELSAQLEALPAGQELLAPINEYAAQYASLPQPATSLIDDAASQVSTIVDDISAAVVDARSVLGDALAQAESTSQKLTEATVDNIDKYVVKYEPEARYYDTIRQAALYSLFAVAILLSLILSVGAIMLWPAALKLAVFLLLVLFTVAFALVVVATVGLKVGTDGCANLEAQILQPLENDPKAITIARYYLYNEGATDPKSILSDVFLLDVDAMLAQVASARQSLQQSLQTYNLRGALDSAVTSAVANSFGVADAVLITLAKISYDNVNNVYVEIKQYPCCTGLDFIGGVWTGIIISGFFIFIQCILAMILIGYFDKLQLPRCCMWYSGKAGEAALLKLNGGTGNNGGHDGSNGSGSIELEAGRVSTAAPTGAAAPDVVVMSKAAAETATPARQSSIFRFFRGGRRSSVVRETANRPVRTISTTADATAAGTQQNSTEEARGRSSAPPPPASAPQWGT